MKLSRNALNDIFFAAVFLLLLAGAILSYRRVDDLIKAGDSVNHTNVVKLKLEELLSVIRNGESAQRGYLLTKDSSFLTPYLNTKEKAHLLLDEITKLSEDNQSQQSNVQIAAHLLNRRSDMLDANLKYFSKTGAVNKDSLREGGLRMDALRNALLKMQLEEERLLRVRTQTKIRYDYVSPLFVLVFTMLILIVVIFAFKKIREDRHELLEINSSLESKNNEIIQTKNFLQLLLDSSVDLISSLDKELNFITMNRRSVDIINKAPEEIIGKSLFEVYANIEGSYIHEGMKEALTGKIVHLQMVPAVTGRKKFFDIYFIPLVETQMITGILSITRDVTDLANANEQLKNTNEELKRSNAELASFNYIASHDLQEPLRKIQIFSDRILHESHNELSEETQRHFGKITNAAFRMRKLIDALLSYSLTTGDMFQAENTDLNKLLDEVKEQVTEDANNTEIIINSENLPVAKVIPVQFQQLLFNLIGNAVKYSKPSEAIIINISVETKGGEKLNQPGAMTGVPYLCLYIKDNGIGFEQEEAERIFNVFTRLHGNAEYSGTGVGLSIVRKVVENHKGHIWARSAPGEGATFNILLPAE